MQNIIWIKNISAKSMMNGRNWMLKSGKKLFNFSDKVIVDEYQAYRYSEKANFFGVKL